MRRFLPLAVSCAVLLLSAATGQAKVTLSIACGSVGQEGTLCREGAEAWAEKTGNAVRFLATPRDATNRLALYEQILSAGTQDADVFQVDVVWPGILGHHFLDLKPHFNDEALTEFFPTVVTNNTIDEKLVAIPWFMDTGLLYYRKDLLDKYGHLPPQTWEDLQATAADIQSRERRRTGRQIWGYVFQGKGYEGLTCNAIEWLSSWDAGTIIDKDGSITINNPATITALKTARSWIGTITPPAVLNYAEEETRLAFLQGRAVFMRGWPYMWQSLNADNSPMRDKVAITHMPRAKGTRHLAGVLGGSQLAVSKYTSYETEAVSLVKYLTSKEEQQRRALAGALSPSRPDLYTDGEILARNPHFALAKDVYRDAAPRPSTVTGLRYNQVSYEFWNTVHDVLGGRRTAEKAVPDLVTRLERISRNGQW